MSSHSQYWREGVREGRICLSHSIASIIKEGELLVEGRKVHRISGLVVVLTTIRSYSEVGAGMPSEAGQPWVWLWPNTFPAKKLPVSFTGRFSYSCATNSPHQPVGQVWGSKKITEHSVCVCQGRGRGWKTFIRVWCISTSLSLSLNDHTLLYLQDFHQKSLCLCLHKDLVLVLLGTGE